MKKFNKGDHVQITKELGQSMSHFKNDCEAIVLYTYNDKYGGGDIDSYCLHIKRNGKVAWYYEKQLKLIEANRLDLLEQWEAEEKEETNMKSDLDWIFEHGIEILEGDVHGATIKTLAKCFGLTNLWGKNGEGVAYYNNARGTLHMAKPFLERGDKAGWLAHCKTIVQKPEIQSQGEA